GNQHIARAGDRPPRLVDDLGGDRILVVLVAVQRLGRRRVDGDAHGAVPADRHLVLQDDLWRVLGAAPPRRNRPLATPLLPAGEPHIVSGEPPVTRAVEPVPGAARIPRRRMVGAQYLVLHPGAGHRGAEIILRLDRGLDGLAQLHRLLGCLNCYLELRLLVLLDAETAAAKVVVALIDREAVGPKGGSGGQGELTGEPGVGVGGEVLLVDLVAPGIVDADGEGLVGEVGRVGLVVPGMPHPGLELDGVLWTVDGPIGDGEDPGRVVLGVMDTAVPDAAETQVSEAVGPALAVLRLASDDQPGVVLG